MSYEYVVTYKITTYKEVEVNGVSASEIYKKVQREHEDDENTLIIGVRRKT